MRYVLILSAALCIGLAPGLAGASYYAGCKAHVKIHKIHPTKGLSFKGNLRVTFSIQKIISGRGHNPKVCNKFLKKRLTRRWFVPKKVALGLHKGSLSFVRYREWSSRGPKGTQSGKSWRWIPAPKKNPKTPTRSAPKPVKAR